MTTSLSRGVGIGVSIISTASIEVCTITCFGMMMDLKNLELGMVGKSCFSMKGTLEANIYIGLPS